MNCSYHSINKNSIDATVCVAATFALISPPINSTSNMIDNIRSFFTSLNADHNIKSHIIKDFNLTLDITISKQDTCDNRCTALVENINGQRYQCTRKRKFGNVCGLHHKRKNSFKSIQSNTESDKYTFTLNMINHNTNSINKASSPLNSSQYYDEFKDIKWKNNYYILHISTGNVYHSDTEELIGHINQTNIPIYYSND